MTKKKKKAKGILPHSRWLQNNGYQGLDHCMRKFPKLFEHIEQDKKRNTVEENVKLAEQLENKYGELPHFCWLKKHGYNNIAICMNKYPKEFRHIKKSPKKTKSIKENVKLAEELAKKNNGILPNSKWLTNNGHSDINRCLYHHKQYFSHIKQKSKKGKTPQEWVKIAENLVENNNGELHSSIWLIKNGYAGLVSCKQSHPELFSHFNQKNRLRTIEEWIEIAKNLAIENKGVLYSQQWLRKNGYNQLRFLICKSPEKFYGIKQEFYTKGQKRTIRIIGEK